MPHTTSRDVPTDVFQHSPRMGEGFVVGEREERGWVTTAHMERCGRGRVSHDVKSLRENKSWSGGPGRVRGHQVEVAASEFHVSVCPRPPGSPSSWTAIVNVLL